MSFESAQNGRQRLAREIRRVRPERLADWDGFEIAAKAGRVNPYTDFADSYRRGDPRDVRLAELLVGDVFADALLHDDMAVKEVIEA